MSILGWIDECYKDTMDRLSEVNFQLQYVLWSSLPNQGVVYTFTKQATYNMHLPSLPLAYLPLALQVCSLSLCGLPPLLGICIGSAVAKD